MMQGTRNIILVPARQSASVGTHVGRAFCPEMDRQLHKFFLWDHGGEQVSCKDNQMHHTLQHGCAACAQRQRGDQK